jgi:uncharacterized glyoxalase superfamily protein PhnB
MSTVWSCLTYRDPHAAADFLERAFGFERRAFHEDGDGHVVHAELRPPGAPAGVMFGTFDDASESPFKRLSPGAGTVYVVCADTDAVHARAAAAGAEILKAPYDTDYGSHDFLAADPEGNLWQFGTYGGA